MPRPASYKASPRHAGLSPVEGMRLIQQAASFAAREHERQYRKDGVTPFAAHPFRVAMTVRHLFACDDPIVVAIALLHDTIEDCPVDYDDLEKRFGRAVADGVAALTKNTYLREDIREAEYDQRLAAADWRPRLVKLADAYDNYCDTAGMSPAMKRRATLRARRAIQLASVDAVRHPEVARGILMLRDLID